MNNLIRNSDNNIYNMDSSNKYLSSEIYKKLKFYSSEKDLFNLVSILLFNQKENDIGSELFKFFPDRNNLFEFLEVFGGKELKVPTIEEFIHKLKVCIFLYHYDILQKTFKDSVIAAGFEYEDTKIIEVKNQLLKERSELLQNVKKSITD